MTHSRGYPLSRRFRLRVQPSTLAPSYDFFSPSIARRLRHRNQKSLDRKGRVKGKVASLSSRELEVLKHVVRGRLNKQIARDLGIHERTVKLHRTGITTKLGVNSTAELTRLWMDFAGPDA